MRLAVNAARAIRPSPKCVLGAPAEDQAALSGGG